MLRRLTVRQFLEWKAYFALEPWGEERADQRTAAIERALYQIFVPPDKTKFPKGYPLDLFVLKFGDGKLYIEPAPAKLTEAEKEAQWKRNKALLFAYAHALALPQRKKRG